MSPELTTLQKIIQRHVNPNEHEWTTFSNYWKPVKFEKHEMVTMAGEVEKYFYFIHEGLIRAFFEKDGEEYNIGFSYHGDPSGVYDSFHTQTPSNWSLQALESTTGLRISYQDLNHLFSEFKVFEKWGRLFFTDAAIGLGLFIRSILADSAEEKFRKLIERSPHIIQIVPQKHLASYLGMTPETYSRMRRKWMNNELDIDQDK